MVVVAGAAAGILLVAESDDPGPRDPGPAGPTPLAGYTVTYRVEVMIDRPERSRRVVAVRRPFDGADRTTPADPPGPESGLVARAGHLYRVDPDRVIDLGDQGPAVAPGDLRIAAQLPWLERLGLVEPRGSGTVAGRQCRWFRFGGPVTDRFQRPTDREYADACLDAGGLVLAEEWHLDGRLLRRTEAEAVVATPPGDDAFDLGGRPAVSSPTVALTPLSTDDIPEIGRPYWTADQPPAGFALLRRYRATTTEPGSGLPLPGGEVTADAFQAGPEVVWVEHRAELEVEPPEGAGERVSAGPLGDGWLWLTPQGPQIRVATGGGVVVVRGTVAPDDLVTFARSVRRPGSER